MKVKGRIKVKQTSRQKESIRQKKIMVLPQVLVDTGAVRTNEGVLVRLSIAVRRHNDYGNSYKERHLIGARLQFQSLSPLWS